MTSLRRICPRRICTLPAGISLALALASAGVQGAGASTAGPNPNGFRGILQFTGSPQVKNPSVAGGILLLNWADLEPSEGTFRWDRIDSLALPWISHGKQVAIRIQTAVSSGGPATPGWLFGLGLPSVSVSGSKVPVYWNSLYLRKLQAFVSALGARYDGRPGVAWIQGGVGMSGETKIDSRSGRSGNGLAAWRRAGYSDPLWFDTIKQIVGIYHSALPTTPLAVSVANSFAGGTSGYDDSLVVDWLASSGAWLQNDSLTKSTVLTNSNWLTVPNIQEQFASASKSGDGLRSDLQRAISVGGTFAAVYGSDIKNPKNQSALDWAASQVGRAASGAPARPGVTG